MIGLPAPDSNTYAPERWIELKGYAHPYEVSTWGRCWSPVRNRFLVGYKEPRGVFYDLILHGGRRRWIYAGRLVMEAFNPVGNMHRRKVIYRNGDVYDTHIENLWWTDGHRARR